jgi:hypothetical protein
VSCNQLPTWVQYLQAMSTPVVALLALAIGLAQWRTAHQRAVLDLFEKRWDVYQAIANVLGEVTREGRAPLQASLNFSRATGRVDFLFGPESGPTWMVSATH